MLDEKGKREQKKPRKEYEPIPWATARIVAVPFVLLGGWKVAAALWLIWKFAYLEGRIPQHEAGLIAVATALGTVLATGYVLYRLLCQPLDFLSQWWWRNMCGYTEWRYLEVDGKEQVGFLRMGEVPWGGGWAIGVPAGGWLNWSYRLVKHGIENPRNWRVKRIDRWEPNCVWLVDRHGGRVHFPIDELLRRLQSPHFSLGDSLTWTISCLHAMMVDKEKVFTKLKEELDQTRVDAARERVLANGLAVVIGNAMYRIQLTSRFKKSVEARRIREQMGAWAWQCFRPDDERRERFQEYAPKERTDRAQTVPA